MPFQPPPRPSAVLASVLAAGIVLAVASCSHVTPLGPGPAAVPQPHQLRSPFVLQAMRIQPPAPAGRCPAGSVALPGGPGQCYRKVGTPLTITSAAISPAPAPPPGQPAGPAAYGFVIAVPAADQAALTAVTTTAYHARGYLAIIVAGRTWLLPEVVRPFTGPHFEVALPSKSQTLQLRRMLAPSG